MKDKLNSKKGASIVIALVLLMVVLLSCSSLFLIISSSIRHSGQEKDREQAMILAQSMNDLIRNELRDKRPVNADNEEVEPPVGSISDYLYRNIGSGWGYYNPDESFNSNKTQVTRNFLYEDGAVLFAGNDSLTENLKARLTISIYWASDSESEAAKNYSGDVRTLYITSTAAVQGKDGEQSASITSEYEYRLIDGSEVYWWEYGGSY